MAGEVQQETDQVRDTVEGGLDGVQHAVNDLLDTAKKAVHRSQQTERTRTRHELLEQHIPRLRA